MLFAKKTQRISRISAQIMALTMLMLFITSIIAVAIFNVVSRDVQQTIANTQYQNLYNVAENTLLAIADKYTSNTVPLSQLPDDYGASCNANGNSQFTCNIITGNITTRLIAQESNTVSNFALDKDAYIEIDISNYTNDVYFSYAGAAALEIGLLFTTSNGNHVYIGDIFDPSNVMGANNGGNPINDTNGNHAFNYSVVGSEYRFNIAQTDGYVPGSTMRRLRFTVRKPAAGAITLNVRGNNNFPTQIRTFTASSYYTNNTVIAIVANAQAQVPILNQSFGLLDYALSSGGAVVKDPVSF
jgi:hypothetical protein